MSQWNNSFDILDVVWPATTNLSFLILVLDQGTPTRGTYANVTVEMSNTCLIDTEFLPITYHFNVDRNEGDMVLRIPGFFHADFCEWLMRFVAYDIAYTVKLRLQLTLFWL